MALQFFPSTVNEKLHGQREKKVLINITAGKIHVVNYHFQSKTYGNPSLRPGCQATPAQMRLNVDHIFY